MINGNTCVDVFTSSRLWTAKFSDFCKTFQLKGVHLLKTQILNLKDVERGNVNTGKTFDVSQEDRDKLYKSFEDDGVNPELPPICILGKDITLSDGTVVKAGTCLNGTTRLDILPELNYDKYCFWILEFDNELCFIDFCNQVNDPQIKYYARQASEADVQQGVIDYLKAYKNITGQLPNHKIIVDQVLKYGRHSLTKEQRKNVVENIEKLDTVPKEEQRYRRFDTKSFFNWVKSRNCVDSLKNRIPFYYHNSKQYVRWLNWLLKSGARAKDDKPMHTVHITPPPKKNGDEWNQRAAVLRERKKYVEMIRDLANYMDKHNGKLPHEVEDAITVFAPVSREELARGKFITVEEVEMNKTR